MQPMGSRWKIVSIDELAINIFETKIWRGSSYIETPEKFANAKCRLIDISNDDEECFRWCALYHTLGKDKALRSHLNSEKDN